MTGWSQSPGVYGKITRKVEVEKAPSSEYSEGAHKGISSVPAHRNNVTILMLININTTMTNKPRGSANSTY